MELHEALAARVRDWRDAGYPHETYPAIGEILAFAIDGDGPGATSRYLRAAQLRALETYWYLRLVARTPRIADLYASLFAGTAERMAALGLDRPALKDVALNLGYPGLLDRIRTDDAFVREHRLESQRETLTLGYPSWILALAMGAGKTVLIGAIVATEFAMAMEYPDAADDDHPFIENALVFAPGTTIIESLRELGTVPYERILPPRFLARFAASVKLTFTRDGERDIPVIRGSRFNLVVTNTEKIRIQTSTRRAAAGGVHQLSLRHLDETRREEAEAVANLRLQAVASLPHLGVFSDEAHHTYGRSLDTNLKRVRQTVDYLSSATNVIAVINTTGTPYFERQPLRDVVVWYGLAQGIADGILKEVAGNIRALSFEPEHADEFVTYVVDDFLAEYGDHRLPDGSPARLAIYFPQTDDLDELAPHVELAVARAGMAPTTILRNTSKSSQAEIDAFNRLNDPLSPHRVILLVNKGTEGWNCPSLFATALARKLRTSQNFVLQAASRCLRQVPGNDRPARIYLSESNRAALDTQLRETYGESLSTLDRSRRVSQAAIIRLRKTDIPPIRVRVPRRVLARGTEASAARPAMGAPTLTPLTFERPSRDAAVELRVSAFDVGLSAATRRVLRQVGEAVAIETATDTIDLRTAASTFGATYRVPAWPILDALRVTYADDDIPVGHLDALATQLEASLGAWGETVAEEEQDLAVIKPDGFDLVRVDGDDVRQAEISYPADRAALVWPVDRVSDNIGGFGFHYTPYNFDSTPEADFYERVLRALNLEPHEVHDVYFTGAITDPSRTDLSFAYAGRDGREHRYTPDFVVHARGDRWLLVEIKMTARRDDPTEGRDGLKAARMRDLEARNPGRLYYRIVFADETIAANDVEAVRTFLGG